MNASKTLFIGGPKDGKREVIPQHCGYAYQCATMVQPRDRVPDIADPLVGVTTHTYLIRPLVGENGTAHQVAVHSSVTNVMEALLKGYRYNRKPVDPYTRSQRKMRTKIQAIYNGQPPYPPVWMNP
jgi:hypothetical protein